MFNLTDVLLINYLLGVLIIAIMSLPSRIIDKKSIVCLILIWPIGLLFVIIDNLSKGSENEKENN